MPTKFAMRLLAGTAVSALLTGASFAADAEARPFDIPQQDAATALQAFAMQSGRQVLFPYEAARGKPAPEIKGDYADEEVIALLAASAGLRVTADDGRTVTLRPQLAQAAGGGGGNEVEALIVTAQKREEDIQDVPIAISAFTQEQLERSQVAGGPDLMTQVPNMTFTKTNFSSYSIQIRGIGTQAISATTDAAVAVAFNNTPFIRNRFFEQEFYDLQRVEVLRGPQGTLYGRNATAGVVNLISQKPKFNFEAKASGDLANYNSSRIEGMVNIPLVEDVVALRLAGAWTKREGYAVNQVTGNPIDGRDLWSTRLSLRFAPTERIEANLIWEHFEEDDDRLRSGKQLCKTHIVTEVAGITEAGGTVEVPLSQNPGLVDRGFSSAPLSSPQGAFSQGCAPASLYSPDSFQKVNGIALPYYTPLGSIGLPTALDNPYESLEQSRDLRVIEAGWEPQYRAKSDLAELQLSFDLTDSLTLTSETAYAVDTVFSTQDYNRFATASGAWESLGGPGTNFYRAGVLNEGPNGTLEFCDPQLGCSDRLVAADLSTAEARQFSQELRVGSSFDGPFNFSLGANFLRTDSIDRYYVFINSLSMISALGVGQVNYANLPYQAGVTDNTECLQGRPEPDYAVTHPILQCTYMDPNPIDSLDDLGHNYFLSKNPYKLISYAMFGEVYYNLAENLKLTGGLRFTVDKKHAPLHPSWLLASNTLGHPVSEIIDQEWREPTGRLGIDWKPALSFTDETLLYATYAHGYKAGGANPPPFGIAIYGGGDRSVQLKERTAARPKTFEAEFVDAYEIGAKNTLLDGRLTLNLGAFYYDYTGYQISQIIDRSAANLNFDAEVWGAELEADWRARENLKLGLKLGYEGTRVADGERAIDIMNRTAGDPRWIVVRPFPSIPSNCILPAWLYLGNDTRSGAHGNPDLVNLGGPSGGTSAGCELTWLQGIDPGSVSAGKDGVINYTAYSTDVGDFPGWMGGDTITDRTYPGVDLDEIARISNNGEGIFTDLSGNELPNAPHFTATITADYTIPLPNDWLATLHTDLYYQSEAWTRIFNTDGYDKLKAYTNINLAAIFTNEDAGWKVMAYIKNVFDRDSITGAFLNSDDTGLTTNVFLTEPRLYGLRVTKEWNGGPLFGSFGARSQGPFPLTVELGGQVQRHDAQKDILNPAFTTLLVDELNPLGSQDQDLEWGDGREVKVTYRPSTDWTVSLAGRFGKTNGSQRQAATVDEDEADASCLVAAFICEYYPTGYFLSDWGDPKTFSESTVFDKEEHTIIDFAVGREIGFGALTRSAVSAGIRHARLESLTRVSMGALPDWNFPAASSLFLPSQWHFYEAEVQADREFVGAGPFIAWDAAQRLLGSDASGWVEADLSLSGGVLFGKQRTEITGEVVDLYYNQCYNNAVGVPHCTAPIAPSRPRNPQVVTTTPLDAVRSESISVPTFAAAVGLSYTVDRFRIGAGYRWERYFDALDGGGLEDAKDVDRTIDGPYFKLSVGFGG